MSKKPLSESRAKYGDKYDLVHSVFALRHERGRELSRFKALVVKYWDRIYLPWLENPNTFLEWADSQAANLGTTYEYCHLRRRDMKKDFSPANCYLILREVRANG